MTAWRKEPPTVDGWHWFRGSQAFNPICDEKPRPLGTKPLRVRTEKGHAQVDSDGRGTWVNAEWFVGEWAPCLPPDSAPPAFPPEVMEAAREALRRLKNPATRMLATGNELAWLNCAEVLARAILTGAPACPHALTTSRLADGELAPDERTAAEEHIAGFAGCAECRETVETAGRLAALANGMKR